MHGAAGGHGRRSPLLADGAVAVESTSGAVPRTFTLLLSAGEAQREEQREISDSVFLHKNENSNGYSYKLFSSVSDII